MSLRTADYDYALPEELIARHPAAQRDGSRMMVIRRATGAIEHHGFADFARIIPPDALVVLNDTRVIPARVFSDDGRVELLLLEQLGPAVWKSMVRPGRKMRAGAAISVGNIAGRVEAVLEDGPRVIAFAEPLDLERVGRMPIPPYFERDAEPEDTERYQTRYAREPGAVAAPTAGLHFTPEILAAVRHAFVTLHVGAGTFKPVSAEVITDHVMHEERFVVTESAAAAINAAKTVIAAGTTTVRVLETCLRAHGRVMPGAGETRIFLYPPADFLRVGGLLTNFHLPKSTLLMLVSAFAGRDLVLQAYAEAIRARYRFYSYGDCMLIL